MSLASIGGHPAVDFLNTAFAPDGVPVEMIGDGKSLLAWAVASELMTPEEAARLTRKLGVRSLDAAAADVRKFREWSRSWLQRWRVASHRDYSKELEALNEALSLHVVRPRVTQTRQGLQLEHRSSIETTDDLLGALAAHVAALLAYEEPGRLKSCGGQGCTLWFLDRTKAQRRIFCSAATCGNRAKVAAFRERQR